MFGQSLFCPYLWVFMTQEMIIDKFGINDCGYYQVYYTGKRFYFTLIPCYDILKKTYGKSALFYVDDETTDDVGYNKKPFDTIDRIMRAVADYVNQSHYTKGVESITHFSFSSSTERKDGIYERYAKKLIALLDGDWGCSSHGGGFYFFLKNTIIV